MDNFSQFALHLQPSAIRAVSKAIHGKKVISFAGGMPHPGSFPQHELGEISAEILASRGGEALQYGATQGYAPLLETMVAYLQGRGLKTIDTKQVLIAAGSQQAIDLVARLLIDPGDLVLMESPGYPGASAAFANLGARVEGIPVLADGPDLEVLERVLRRERPRFFYVTPNFANPAGVLMSCEKRQRIAELAARHDFWIVEDDAYGELYFSELSADDTVPLKAYDRHDRVIYMQTFSKTIAPGLRVAAIAGPPQVIQLVETIKQIADMFTSTYNQMLVNEFILRGYFAAKLPDLRALYESRRNAMERALEMHLPEAHWVTPKGGFFFWLEMPEGFDAQALLEPALAAGIAFMPGESFYLSTKRPQNTIRLAYSREPEDSIERGIARLGELARASAQVSSTAPLETSIVR